MGEKELRETERRSMGLWNEQKIPRQVERMQLANGKKGGWCSDIGGIKGTGSVFTVYTVILAYQCPQQRGEGRKELAASCSSAA